MPNLSPDKRKVFDRRLAALRNERDQSWTPHWRDLSDFILPRRGRFLYGASTGGKEGANRGDKRNSKIIDSTGTIAARTLAAGLMSVTSPARPWLKFTVPDQRLREVAGVRTWCDDVRDAMLHIFSRSNLYVQLPVLYEELGVFGTGVLESVEDHEDVMRFYALTVGEYMLANGPRLTVQSLYREFPLTVAQIVEEFGEENCSRTVLDLWKADATENWITIVHLVEPNDERMPGAYGWRGKAWRSVYYESGSPDEQYLRIRGFHAFPYQAVRWHITGTDVYARAPGMDALPDVKQLQVMSKREAQAIDKMVNPPMTAPTALRNAALSVLPGDIVFVDEANASTTGRGGFRPTYEVDPRLQDFRVAKQEVQGRIRGAFYADLFMAISQMEGIQPRNELEISERRDEKLLQLGPVLERLYDDLLDPLVDRTFAAMVRANLVPEAPPEMQGSALAVEYINPLQQAQTASGIQPIERVIGFVGGLVKVGMSDSLDKIDTDQTVELYAEMAGAPARIIRSGDDVAKIRQQKQQAIDAARTASMSTTMVDSAQKLSQTDTGGKNALTDMAKVAAANQGGAPAGPGPA